jgi:hypothetical protein
MLPEKNSGEHTVTVVSVHLSFYLLNLSSEINVVDNKLFLDTRVYEPKSLKVILESSWSLRADKRIQLQHFFI